MQQNGKYGVLLLGGNRTHQENYALSFAQDASVSVGGIC